MLIKNTKLAEERQSVALSGKRTIEDIENVIAENAIPQKDVKNYKITKSGDQLTVSGLNFLQKEESENKKLELTKSGESEAFSGRISLDSNYNFCDVSGKETVYEEEITIEKAKGKKQGEIGSGTSESKAEDDIDIDKDNLDEKADDINKDINSIENEFSMIKKEGKDSESIIKSGEDGTDENTISSDGILLILNVLIDKDGKVSITDGEKKTCVGIISNKLDDTKVNHLNLHFNFKKYLKGKDEKLKDLKINVYNEIENSSKNVVNVYIEKSVDLNVIVKAAKGEINIFNRDENNEITKIGPLYNIKVKILQKEDLEVLEKEPTQLTPEEKAKILFNGYSNKNIRIKENT